MPHYVMLAILMTLRVIDVHLTPSYADIGRRHGRTGLTTVSITLNIRPSPSVQRRVVCPDHRPRGSSVKSPT